MHLLKKYFLFLVSVLGIYLFLPSVVSATDVESPVISSFVTTSTSTSPTVSINSFISTDNVGVAGYLLSETSAIPNINDANWSVNIPNSYSFSNVNNISPNLWASSTFGNIYNWKFISSSADGTKLALAVNDSYLYVSSNSGATWTQVTSLGTHKWSSLTISADGTKMAATAIDYVNSDGYFDNSANVKLFRSVNGGLNWSSLSSVTQGISDQFYTEYFGFGIYYPNILHIAASADGNKLVAVDSSGYVYSLRCPEGEVCFPLWSHEGTIRNDVYSISSLISSADGNKMAAITTGNLFFTSSDNGSNWTERIGSGDRYWSSAITSPDNTKLSIPFGDYSYINNYGNYLYAWTKDAAGNISNSKRSHILISNELPFINSFSLLASTTTTTVPILSFKSSNSNEIIGYKVSEVSTTPLASDSGWLKVAPTNYTFTNHGVNKLYAWVKDEITGVSNVASSTTLIDTKPFVSSFSLRATSSSLTVPIDSFVAVDDIGVTGYMVSETSTPPLYNNAGWLSEAPETYTFESVNTENPSRAQILVDMGSHTWGAITSSADSGKIIAAKGSTNGYIHISNNGGGTWTQKTSAGLRSWNSLSSSANGNKIVASAQGGLIYVSVDGGETWNDRSGTTSSELSGLAYSADGSTLVKSYRNGYIYTSNNDGSTWTQRTSAGSRTWSDIALSADGSKIAATNNNGYIYTSVNSGESWTQQTNSGVRSWSDITSSSDGLKLRAADARSIHISNDAGQTWEEVLIEITEPLYIISLNSSDDGERLAFYTNWEYFMHGLTRNIFLSNDGGFTWNVIPDTNNLWSGLSSSVNGKRLFLTSGNDGKIYNFNYGNTLYAWTKDSTNNVSEEQFFSTATIDLTPVNLDISSSSANLSLTQDMIYVPTTINIPKTVNNSTLDFSSISTNTSTTTKIVLPQRFTFNTTSDRGNIKVDIPSGSTIIASNPAWAAIITLPKSVSPSNSVVGDMKNILSAYEIGDPNNHLVLDKAAKLTFYNSANKRIGFSNSDNVFHEIVNNCIDDTQDINNLLSAGSECKINSGNDLIVWTKHFSEYILYEDVVQSSSSFVAAAGNCLDVVYSDWETCSGKFNIQFRTVISQSPANCSLTTEQRQKMERACLLENNNTTNRNSLKEFLDKEKLFTNKADSWLSKKLAGRILLQVENRGEAWYVNPLTKLKHYLGRPEDAFNLMKNLGLGISNNDLAKFKKYGVPKKYSGRIFLQVEDKGQAYYIDPINFKLNYLGRPEDAFNLMKNFGLGVSNINIRSIEIAD